MFSSRLRAHSAVDVKAQPKTLQPGEKSRLFIRQSTVQAVVCCARLAGHDRGVVLAPAEGADALVADQAVEGLAVLVAAQVLPELLLGGDVGGELRALAQVVAAVDGEEDGTDDGGGGGHAGGGGDVAGDGAVHAEQPGEVGGEPAQRRGRVVGPVPALLGLERGGHGERDVVAGHGGGEEAALGVVAVGRHDAEGLADRRQQAAPRRRARSDKEGVGWGEGGHLRPPA